MDKERFEWSYNETMLKHYMVDNQNNIQLGYEAIVNLLNQQNKQIADLEAKLSERNEYFSSFGCEDFNEFQDFISTFMLTPHEEQELIQQLKQQLDEKEKEIEELNDKLKFKSKWLKIADNMVGQSNQNKISFCIEKLEKVKKKFNGKRPIDELANEVGIDLGYTSMQIQNYIDNQIEKLKKEMK